MARKNKGMQWYDWLLTVLAIIGGLNWGLIAFFGFNLVEFISLGSMLIERVIYGAVGVASFFAAIRLIWIAMKK